MVIDQVLAARDAKRTETDAELQIQVYTSDADTKPLLFNLHMFSFPGKSGAHAGTR